MKKNGFLILFVCSLLMCLVSQPVTAGKKVLASFGTTSSASGYYAYCVGVAKAINKALPRVKITVLETWGW